MKRTKLLPRSKNTLSKAKAKAWKAFSLWVRLTSCNSLGIGGCYTCGKAIYYKSANAGHGIGGRNNAILFEERVVRLQCIGCNVWGRGQYQIFTRKLIDELGLATYDEIVSKARIPVKYRIADYEAIEADYKERIKNLG